jgi:hypothetical protein
LVLNHKGHCHWILLQLVRDIQSAGFLAGAGGVLVDSFWVDE